MLVYEVVGCSCNVFARGKLINSSNLVNTLSYHFVAIHLYPDEGKDDNSKFHTGLLMLQPKLLKNC